MGELLKVATLQFAMSANSEKNIQLGQELVIEAAKNGARLILLPELFATPYFCKKQKAEYLKFAHEVKDNPILAVFSKLAKELNVV